MFSHIDCRDLERLGVAGRSARTGRGGGTTVFFAVRGSCAGNRPLMQLANREAAQSSRRTRSLGWSLPPSASCRNRVELIGPISLLFLVTNHSGSMTVSLVVEGG